MVVQVAVAGPNGSLGPTVIKHLAKQGFAITLLTRNPDKAAKQFPAPVKTLKVDYDSHQQLTDVLRDGAFDTIVDLTNREQLQAQKQLIDAAIAAKVPHYVPSCFGIETSSPEVRKVPQAAAKVQMQDYLKGKAEEGLINFTAINTGLFLDFVLERYTFPVNLKGGPTFLADAGDVKVSASTLDFIGQAVAQAIVKRDEARNRFLYVHSTAITQNQLLQYARELAPDRDFPIVPVDTEKAARASREKIANGEGGPEVAMPLLMRVSFGLGLGLFHEVDNELLGLSTMSEEEVKDLVASFVK